MDTFVFTRSMDVKPDLEPGTTICRCCLSTEKLVKSIGQFSALFMDLAGVCVTESDGLPQWLCLECVALLKKAVKFKQKMLKAHSILYNYLNRCAPFPIDAQDPELAKYASPHLTATPTLTAEVSKGKIGFSKILQHTKELPQTELDLDIQVDNAELQRVQKYDQEPVKEETSFSDYEDNITLEEYRSNVNKLTEEDMYKVTEDDLADLLEASEEMQKQETEGNKKSKRKEEKKEKVKKKKKNGEQPPEIPEPKSSLRKPVDLDPSKIRVIMLDPEQQFKERQEESKKSLKFPFQCHLCFKGFNFEAKLQNHMAKHSPSRGQFECKLCSMFLPTHHSYTVHSYIHTRRYECVQCGRRMVDRLSIVDHYKTQHEGLVTMYTCHVCGKVSNNSKTHRGHIRNHHSGERPSCDQCGKSFVNKDSLAEHVQIHQGVKNYSCGVCGKRFRTRTQIKHHQLKHSDAKDYYCVECDTRFKSAHSLRQHLQKSVKHKDKHSFNLQCPRCDKRFDTERRLQHHVSIHHEGLRAHRCDICGATLATAGSLHKHMRAVHEGLKPPPRHVCHACGKAFRGKSVLMNHVRTHTGEKPFECATCGRRFAQRTAMRTHVKLVHLKCRRHNKIKPEESVEQPEVNKLELFPKQEAPLVFDTWRAPTDVYYLQQ